MVENDLLELEKAFWDAAGSKNGKEFYRNNFSNYGKMILPFKGGILNKQSILPIISKSQKWQSYDFSNVAVSTLSKPHLYLITYSVEASHGSDKYNALISSLYVLTADKYKLCFHQQTAL